MSFDFLGFDVRFADQHAWLTATVVLFAVALLGQIVLSMAQSLIAWFAADTDNLMPPASH